MRRVGLLSVVLLALPFVGCKKNTGDDGGVGGDETGGWSGWNGPTCNPSTCPPCSEGSELYTCICPEPPDAVEGNGIGQLCFSTEWAAFVQCGSDCSEYWIGKGGQEPAPDPTVEELVCACNPDRGSCSSWAPEDEVTLTGGVYYMEAGFISSVIDDPAPLWTCDDAYLAANSGSAGKFQVKAANAGELLYELGLRNDDIPQSLNGLPLADYDDVAQTFYNLWIGTGATEYDLVVKRNGSNITLSYELVATFGD